jgi:hypothetical protein
MWTEQCIYQCPTTLIALARFQHPKPIKSQHSLHIWHKPIYGSKQQISADPDIGLTLTAAEVTKLQQIIGVILYFARAVDSTMLVALGTYASQQTEATSNTMKAATQLLHYAATRPDAKKRFRKSDMIFQIHSDSSYLSESEARSLSGQISFLSSNTDHPAINGAIHVLSGLMKNVLASAADTEVGAIFHNAQDACTLRQTLIDMGNEQPPTSIQTDNSCANGRMNSSVKQ